MLHNTPKKSEMLTLEMPTSQTSRNVGSIKMEYLRDLNRKTKSNNNSVHRESVKCKK